jgi:hypothetical protein
VGFAAAKFAVLSSQARNPLTLIYRGKDRAKPVYTASVSGIYFRFKRFRVGRVEDGRGSLGHAATLRFPSPLIERFRTFPDSLYVRARLNGNLELSRSGNGVRNGFVVADSSRNPLSTRSVRRATGAHGSASTSRRRFSGTSTSRAIPRATATPTSASCNGVKEAPTGRLDSMVSFGPGTPSRGANKIKELWQFFLQTKSVWVFIWSSNGGNKMSNPKRIGLKERPRRTPAARELSQRSRERRAPSCQRKAAKNAGGLFR